MINGGLYMRRGDRMIWRAFLAFLSVAFTGRNICIYVFNDFYNLNYWTCQNHIKIFHEATF